MTSPLVRTRQTADVFSETLKTKPAVVTSDALAPAGTPAAVVQEITKHVRKARVALVGHEPNLGELAAQLIGARTPLEFKKGGICRIDFDMLPPKGGGMLLWFATPRMLRKIVASMQSASRARECYATSSRRTSRAASCAASVS